MDNWLNNLAYLDLQASIESEMRTLRFELKGKMEMYESACKEALEAKQKVRTDTSFCISDDILDLKSAK